MKFKEFNFGVDKTYNTGKLNGNYFYVDNSINDKFREYLDAKYNGDVQCYIKPFGSFSREGDNITSFAVLLLDHNNIYKNYINQTNINFRMVENNDNLYRLDTKVMGYSKDLTEILFNDTIEFLDKYFNQL